MDRGRRDVRYKTWLGRKPTLKFNFGVGMLSEGSGVVGTKREIAAEANIGNDGCAERKQSACISFVYACGSDHTCAPDVRGFPVAGIFYDSGGNIAKRAGKTGEFLAGRTQNFSCEKMSKQGEWKWKVDDEDVTVGVIGCSRISHVDEGRRGERGKSKRT